MAKWNVRKKRWWFSYGFRGGEDHVDYTYGLYWWGGYQMFSQTHDTIRIFGSSNGSNWLLDFSWLVNTYILTRG